MTDDEELAQAKRALAEVSAELAIVQDQLAGPRMARQAIRRDIAAECVKADYDEERETGTVLSWRPPSAAECRMIDDVHERTAPVINALAPVERALKHAKRCAEHAVERARKALNKPRRNRAETAQKKCAVLSDGTSRTAQTARGVLPAQKARRNRARAAQHVPSGPTEQMDLFNT